MSQVDQEVIARQAEEIEGLKAERKTLFDEITYLKSELVKHVKPVAEPVAGPPPPFKFSGRVGKPFSIEGTGFGNTVGSLMIGDRQIPPTRWKPTSIKGFVPSDLKTGKIKVTVNGTVVDAVLA